MINTKHLLKVASVWISIVYAVCFLGVALIPNVRPGFMMYGLHTNISGMNFLNVMGVGTFISGLIIWNIVTLFAVWLFAALFNGIKR